MLNLNLIDYKPNKPGAGGDKPKNLYGVSFDIEKYKPNKTTKQPQGKPERSQSINGQDRDLTGKGTTGQFNQIDVENIPPTQAVNEKLLNQPNISVSGIGQNLFPSEQDETRTQIKDAIDPASKVGKEVTFSDNSENFLNEFNYTPALDLLKKNLFMTGYTEQPTERLLDAGKDVLSGETSKGFQKGVLSLAELGAIPFTALDEIARQIPDVGDDIADVSAFPFIAIGETGKEVNKNIREFLGIKLADPEQEKLADELAGVIAQFVVPMGIGKLTTSGFKKLTQVKGIVESIPEPLRTPENVQILVKEELNRLIPEKLQTRTILEEGSKFRNIVDEAGNVKREPVPTGDLSKRQDIIESQKNIETQPKFTEEAPKIKNQYEGLTDLGEIDNSFNILDRGVKPDSKSKILKEKYIPQLKDLIERSKSPQEFIDAVQREFYGKDTQLGNALVDFGYVKEKGTPSDLYKPFKEFYDYNKPKEEVSPVKKYIEELNHTPEEQQRAKNFIEIKRQGNLNLNSVESKFSLTPQQVRKGLTDIAKDNFITDEAKLVIDKINKAYETGIENNATRQDPRKTKLSAEELGEISKREKIKQVYDTAKEEIISEFESYRNKYTEETVKDTSPVFENGKRVQADDIVPNDMMDIINDRYSELFGLKIPKELYGKIRLKELIDYFDRYGSVNEVLPETTIKLRKAGYREIGDMVLTSDGMKPKPKANLLEARNTIKQALNNKNLDMMGLSKLADLTDKKVLKATYDIAKYHLENGLTKFGDWARAVVKDTGNWIKKHLRNLWDEVKAYAKGDKSLVDLNSMSVGIPKPNDKISTFSGSREKFIQEQVKQGKSIPDAQKEWDTKQYFERGMKMRKSSERMARSDEFKDLELEKKPESYYEPQKIQDEKQKIADLPADERMNKFSEMEKMADLQDGNNNAVLSGISLMEEALAKGDTAKFNEVYETLVRAGTTMGQLIRQFAELKTTTPEGVTQITKKFAEKEGVKLTKDKEIAIHKEASEFLKDNAKLKEQIEGLKTKLTPETLNDAIKQRVKTEKSHERLARQIQRSTPLTLDNAVIQAMQGNTLTPGSLLTNVFGNITLFPVRAGTKIFGSTADALTSFLTKKPRTYKGGVTYFWEGAKGLFGKKAPLGSDILDKRYDIQQSFQPLRAWGELLKGDFPRNEKGRIIINRLLAKGLEATVGIPATAMFKGLQVFDVPFRRAYTRATAYEIAKLKGAKDKLAIEKEIQFPTKEAREIIEKEGLAGIFADDNLLVNGLMLGSKYMGSKMPKPIAGLMNLIARPNLLYMKIPLNIAKEMIYYSAPPISLSKAAYHFSKGNKRAGFESLGKAVTGALMWSAADWLGTNGITTGSYETDKKKRNLDYETKKPYSFNYTAFKRLLAGENPQWQKGDEIKSYQKLGIFGGILMLAADYRERKLEGQDFITNTIALSIGIPQYALEQSVMQGIESLVDVFSDKELQHGSLDKWINNYQRLVSNIPLPNTIGQVNKVFSEYIMEQKEYKGLDLVYAEKFGKYDKYKRNMWGQKIPVAPTGSTFDKAVYLLSPIKGNSWSPDDTSLMIMDLFNKTQDKDILPSQPEETFSIKKQKVTLDRYKYEEYLELIGIKRLNGLKNIETDLSDEDKIKEIKKIYDKAQEEAKNEIVNKYNLINE